MDLNHRPIGYEPTALTTELRAQKIKVRADIITKSYKIKNGPKPVFWKNKNYFSKASLILLIAEDISTSDLTI